MEDLAATLACLLPCIMIAVIAIGWAAVLTWKGRRRFR